MTTIETTSQSDTANTNNCFSLGSFFTCAGSWVVSTDHKRIGRLFVGFGLLVLTATTILGATLGFERSDGAAAAFDSSSLLRMFQMYRVGLIFGAIVPLGLGLSVAITPLQLGARSIVFPRLAMTGFYSWLGGLALTVTSLARGGGVSGENADMVDLFLAGHGLMILGLLASAGCVATSILTSRAPGMTMRRVPLFAWSALIGSLSILIALPVLFGAIVYLFVDHRYAQLNFDGAEGIGVWIGWAFSVPAIIVYALPAVGVAAELIPVTFRTRLAMRGPAFAGIALIGVAALAATTQQFVHNVALTGDAGLSATVRDLLPFLIFAGLPILGINIVMGLGLLTATAGLRSGRPRITSAFLFSFAGLLFVGGGMIAALLLAITDLELLGTVFEEGAVLYLVHGTALAVMGGLCFWAPKLWGRVVSEKQMIPIALLGAVAAVLAAFPLFIAGFDDSTGGVAGSDIDDGGMLTVWNSGSDGVLNVLSLVGQCLMALTIVAFAGLLIKTFTGAGPAESRNPFGGHTVEWGAASPAPAWNFDVMPSVASAHPQFGVESEGDQP